MRVRGRGERKRIFLSMFYTHNHSVNCTFSSMMTQILSSTICYIVTEFKEQYLHSERDIWEFRFHCFLVHQTHKQNIYQHTRRANQTQPIGIGTFTLTCCDFRPSHSSCSISMHHIACKRSPCDANVTSTH